MYKCKLLLPIAFYFIFLSYHTSQFPLHGITVQPQHLLGFAVFTVPRRVVVPLVTYISCVWWESIAMRWAGHERLLRARRVMWATQRIVPGRNNSSEQMVDAPQGQLWCYPKAEVQNKSSFLIFRLFLHLHPSCSIIQRKNLFLKTKTKNSPYLCWPELPHIS